MIPLTVNPLESADSSVFGRAVLNANGRFQTRKASRSAAFRASG
jgi:hypothetical protein